MKALFYSLLLLSSFTASGAQADAGREGGGGFSDRNGRAVLAQATEKLLSQLETLPGSGLPELPFPWGKERILEVLRSLDLRPTESRARDGRPLLLDYDLEKEKIIVLKDFFLTYGTIPEGTPLDASQLRDLEKKLLHELSHLWGADEEQAVQYSEEFLSSLDRDMLICVSDLSRFGFGGDYNEWRETKSVLILNRAWSLGLHRYGFTAEDLRKLPAKIEAGIQSEYFRNGLRNSRLQTTFSVSKEDPTLQRFTMQNGTFVEYSTKDGEGIRHNFDGSTQRAVCGFRWP